MEGKVRIGKRRCHAVPNDANGQEKENNQVSDVVCFVAILLGETS
jgi:hypothetical protein